MKKLFFGILLLALMFSFPLSAMAEVNINIGVSLPPVIQFHGPPRLVVLPDTHVYVDPDIDVDIFFNDGWWWRPYQGRWYRSRDYNSGWAHHLNPPSFYPGVPKHWKDDYRKHLWKGHQWNPDRRDHHEVQKNWNHWKKDKYWEKNNNWGIQKAQHKQNEDDNSNKKIDKKDKKNKKDKKDKKDK